MRKLYDALVAANKITISYEEFLQKYNNDAGAQKLHTAMSGDNSYTKSFEEFKTQFEVGKQGDPQQGATEGSNNQQASSGQGSTSQFSEEELARWNKEMEYEGLWETSKFKKENYRQSDTVEGGWVYTDPTTQKSIEVNNEHKVHGELVQALEGTLQFEQEDLDARQARIDERKAEEEKERTAYIDEDFWKQYPNDRDYYVNYDGIPAFEIVQEFLREDERREEMTTTFDVSLDNKEAIVTSGNDDQVAKMYLESSRYPGLEAEAVGFMFGNAVQFKLPNGEEIYVDLIDGDLEEGVAGLQRIDDWYDENGTKAGLSIFQTVNDTNIVGNLTKFEEAQAQLKLLGYDLQILHSGAEGGAAEYTLTDIATGEEVLKPELTKLGKLAQDAGGKFGFNGAELGKWLWENISDEQTQQLLAENEVKANEAIDTYAAKKAEEYAKIDNETAISKIESTGKINDSIKASLEGNVSKEAEELVRAKLDETFERTKYDTGYGRTVRVFEQEKNLERLRNIVEKGFKEEGWRDLSDEDKDYIRGVVAEHSSETDEDGGYTSTTQGLINTFKNTTARAEASTFVQQKMREDYGSEFDSVIAGVDEITSEENLLDKSNAHRKRLGMIEISAKKEVDQLSGELNTLMDEVAKAGLGWKTIELPTGKTKIIIEGDDEELVDKYQNLVNSKLSYIEGVGKQYIDAAREADEEYKSFINQVDNALELNQTINVNFDKGNILGTDIANGFEQLFVGIPAFFGNEAAQERLRMVNAGAQGFETMLTMDQARQYGKVGWFSARTGAQQSANVITAVGTSLIGLPPGVTTALTSTMFGLSSGGGKRSELNGLVEAASRAEVQLQEIDNLLEQGKLTALEHREQKIALEKTIAAGKMEAWQLESAVWSSAIIEGGISALIGTDS